MKQITYTLSLSLLLLASCAKEQNAEKMETKAEESTKPMAIAKQSQIASIVDGYLKVKNALVDDNEKATAEAASIMLAAYSEIKMEKISPEIHKSFMEIYENSKEQLEHIVKSEISHQRSHFKTLSQDTYDLVKLLSADQVLFKEYCPMYNNNTGGMWLSASNEIRNPYFGSKMLKCGTVKETISL